MKLLWETARGNLMYLAMLTLVLVVSFNFSLIESKALERQILYRTRSDLTPLPVLGKSDEVPVVSAQGVIAIDTESRVVLYEKNADLPMLPASTTKIMTALVAMEDYDLDEVLTVNGEWVEGQKMGLAKGEQLTVRDVLDGVLIYSANDGAELLAREYVGGREAFVAEMNRKAKELGLARTSFVNPTGLDEAGHVSTARDLVYLTEVAMEKPLFASIVGTKEKTVSSVDGKISHKLTNINELLGKVDGVIGVKTGWTENARENLVAYVERDGHRVMIALMGSQDRFGETEELIEWIFRSYSWKTLEVPYFEEAKLIYSSP